jgi:UDPglucose--hexose-1-phosphate uridylyltransferase
MNRRASALLDSEAAATSPGAEFRFDALTREWVAITGSRQSRPNLPAGCPFCIGGLEAPEPYDVKVFPNRWPPLQPGDRLTAFLAPGKAVRAHPARGAAEIVLYSPDHTASLATIGAAGIRRVIDVWAERTARLLERAEVEYVLAFENRGATVGATIDHPHGQIYAFPFVPPAARREHEIAQAFGCPVCEDLERELAENGRLVSVNDSFATYARYAATWPYELLIAPRSHLPDLAALDDAHRDQLAEAIADVLARYDALYEQTLPYMLWLHPGFHFHIHLVTPLRAANTMRFVAAGELGSGVMFNPVTPEEAAARLRRAAPLHSSSSSTRAP